MEPLAIGALAGVESVSLLIQVTEQMIRLDLDIGPAQRTLQEAPEILHAVGVDQAVNVSLGVVDDLVLVGLVESLVAAKLIRVDGRTGLDVLADVAL